MKRKLDLRLYLVADVEACGARGVLATVRAAVAGGVTVVQLRDHRATTRELLSTALGLRDLLTTERIGFVVNDRLDIAMAAGADGIHLGQSDLPAEAAREIAGPDLVIGWSVTNLAEAEAAAAFPPGTIDYLGVGPVYATKTKLDAAPAIGLKALRAVCSLSPLPCVAIGGIDAGCVEDLVTAGAAGVAVVAAICGVRDPRTAAAELRGRWGR
jgi:thiamine-phosphate pyrophosphorylase